MAADGHLGMTALPCVTLASAGLSCYWIGMLQEYSLMMQKNLTCADFAAQTLKVPA